MIYMETTDLIMEMCVYRKLLKKFVCFDKTIQEMYSNDDSPTLT